MAEQDRDAYRRQYAALAREKEIMKDVPGWEVSCRMAVLPYHNLVHMTEIDPYCASDLRRWTLTYLIGWKKLVQHCQVYSQYHCCTINHMHLIKLQCYLSFFSSVFSFTTSGCVPSDRASIFPSRSGGTLSLRV